MIGRKIAHYEITSHLSTGGMGEVYLATDSKLGRSVAIKCLPEAFPHDADRVARLQREARVLAALNHSNIAAIYGFEEAGGRHVLVMEFVPGETLDERLNRGPLPVREALDIAGQISEALEAAHEKGILHRDLKPANIKITQDGKVKVLDFGIAKIFDESATAAFSNSATMTSGASLPGVILGTAPYMSPEQARGKPLDKRSDIWAFGTVLFEMLTGRRVFAGETATDVIAAIVHKDPGWESLPTEVPAAIRSLLRRCLAKDIRQRLRDIGDARLEIEAACSESSVDPRPQQGRKRVCCLKVCLSWQARQRLSWPAAGWEVEARPEPFCGRSSSHLKSPSATRRFRRRHCRLTDALLRSMPPIPQVRTSSGCGLWIRRQDAPCPEPKEALKYSGRRTIAHWVSLRTVNFSASTLPAALHKSSRMRPTIVAAAGAPTAQSCSSPPGDMPRA
jgi:serine/threonine protein kinase